MPRLPTGRIGLDQVVDADRLSGMNLEMFLIRQLGVQISPDQFPGALLASNVVKCLESLVRDTRDEGVLRRPLLGKCRNVKQLARIIHECTRGRAEQRQRVSLGCHELHRTVNPRHARSVFMTLSSPMAAPRPKLLSGPNWTVGPRQNK